MKYVRRGTPPTPIPSGKAHTVKPQPLDDADQLVHETATEAIQRRIDAVIEHIVTPEPAPKLVKPVKAGKKPAEKTKVVVKRSKAPAKKK